MFVSVMRMADEERPRPTCAAPLRADLTGKVAFITGGSSEIGLGIAVACAELGMKIAITYQTPEHLVRAKRDKYAVLLSSIQRAEGPVPPGRLRAEESTLRRSVHLLEKERVCSSMARNYPASDERETPYGY